MPKEHLLFIHISDIHRGSLGLQSVHDLDDDIRKALLKDVRDVISKLGPADGVLICGDIAYSGKETEYNVMKEWLDSLCALLGTEKENVWMVPGNHDVERPVAGSKSVKDIRALLRKTDLLKLDNELRATLQDENQGPLLLKALTNYNKFASFFECETNPPEIFWVDEIPLGSKYRVRIHGLNSALVSGPEDDVQADATKLILGSFQTTITPDDGVVNIVLSHHPLRWIRDEVTASRDLNGRTHIQLYGHIHDKRLDRINNSLVIHAGALHPERPHESHLPHYNFIKIEVVEESGKKHLLTQVFPRIWDAAQASFRPEHDSKGNEYHEFKIEQAWRDQAQEKKQMDDFVSGETVANTTSGSGAIKPLINRQRKLLYSFLDLSFLQQIQIAAALGLWEESWKGLVDGALAGKLFTAAKEAGKMPDFWDLVFKEREETLKNPYLTEAKGASC